LTIALSPDLFLSSCCFPFFLLLGLLAIAGAALDRPWAVALGSALFWGGFWSQSFHWHDTISVMLFVDNDQRSKNQPGVRGVPATSWVDVDEPLLFLCQ
jgi:hypothetical protein